MNRPNMVVLCGASLVLFAAGTMIWRAAEVRGADGRSNSVVTKITLKDQLEKGLRARRKVEFEFIQQVLKAVDDEVLPKDLVQSSFNWARKKHSKRIQYFQQSLVTRARKRGIDFNAKLR